MTGPLLRRARLVAAICAAGSGGIASPAQVPAQAPVFRSGVDVVEVDVQMSDASGRPVAGLSAGEFTLLVDGQPRAVSSMEFVRYDEAPSGGPAAAGDPAATALAAASFSSNAAIRSGRMFVLAVDQGNMTRGGGRGAMEAAGRFLDRLSPDDRVALVTLPIGPSAEFTADHALVKAAAAKIVGGGASRYEGSFNRTISLAESYAFVTGSHRRLYNQAVAEECAYTRTPVDMIHCRNDMEAAAKEVVMTAQAAERSTVHALELLFERLGSIEGPKHVVFIGQGLVTGSSFGSLDGLADLDRIAVKAHAARVTLHVVLIGNSFLEAFDVSERRMSRTLVEDNRLIEDGLVQLAGVAGGSLFRLAGKLDPAFDRIARESAAAYVLRFDVTPADRDGKAHTIAVRIRRPGANVRARTSFVAPAAGTSESPAGRRLGMALRAPLVPRALTIELATAVMREAGAPTRRLLVAADIGCGPQAPTAADVALALTDGDGTTRTLTPETATAVVPRGDGECLYYSSTVRVPAGDATIRLAAVSADGRSGAVDRSISLGASQGAGLRLGPLLLTDPGTRVAGKMKVVVDGTVRGRVAASVEADWLSGPPPAAAPRLTFEVAADAGAPALVSFPADLTQDEPGKWYAEGMFDLKALAPGRYVVRAIVATGGIESVRTARVLRIVP